MVRLFEILAQIETPSPKDIGLSPIAATDDTAKTILNVVFGIIASVAIVVIIIAGFNLATGGDDPEKISRSKKAIIYALVGLALAVSTEAIVLTVLNVIGS